MTTTSEPASSFTAQVNRDAAAKYAMTDRADFTDVERGFIAGWDDPLHNDNGDVIHDGHQLDYVGDDVAAPPSVNPSLWRQTQVIRREGLYKVVDGLYQVRGDANLTIVDAPNGLVVIDTTTSVDIAAAGMELFRKHTGNTKPVVAVIYTHTTSITTGASRAW